MTSASLQQLMGSGLLWRGRGGRQPAQAVLPGGWPALDGCLGGGWPRSALVELLSVAHQGLPLLLPVLARLSQGQRWLAWVAPPHQPYAPALAAAGIDLRKLLLVHRLDETQRLWAAEQALKSAACSVVLLWPGRLQATQVRRLQLAAEQGECLGVLFRPLAAARQDSPAALRLQVSVGATGLDLTVLKRRAGWGGQRCRVHFS
jgi:cell division inhibitor SulA